MKCIQQAVTISLIANMRPAKPPQACFCLIALIFSASSVHARDSHFDTCGVFIQAIISGSASHGSITNETIYDPNLGYMYFGDIKGMHPAFAETNRSDVDAVTTKGAFFRSSKLKVCKLTVAKDAGLSAVILSTGI
jgi:hypothetical protein